MQVLVKVRGRKKNQAAIHVYNEATDSALCRSWPKPGDEWELKEVDSFQAVSYWQQCDHCKAKLKPKPPEEPKPDWVSAFRIDKSDHIQV